VPRPGFTKATVSAWRVSLGPETSCARLTGPFPPFEAGAEGLLPVSLFQTVYFCNSERIRDLRVNYGCSQPPPRAL
jgi:hypothetical protein